MAYQETYRKIDKLINESEDFSSLGGVGLNVASTNIDPEHYIRRLAHDNPVLDAPTIRERLIRKSRRHEIEEFTDMLSEGEFGGPRITKKAAKALAIKIREY